MIENAARAIQALNKFSPADMDRYRAAAQFAALAHAGAVRKGTDIPYITHPLEASVIAAQLTDDMEVVMAAVLHDVVEDTDYTEADIAARFGGRIAGLVADESEDKRPDRPAAETWRLRKQETLDHLARASREARIIAFGDKLSNLRAMARDYAAIGDGLWARFNNQDPADHGWYYRSMGRLTAEFADSPLWQEYSRLLGEVFGPEKEIDP